MPARAFLFTPKWISVYPPARAKVTKVIVSRCASWQGRRFVAPLIGGTTMVRKKLAAAAILAKFLGISAASADILHPVVVQANPVNYTPVLVATESVPRPHVDAIAQVGDTIFAGGRFDRVAHSGGSPTYARSNIMAFDARTGVPISSVIPGFRNPSINGQVWAIEAFGDSVYIGGQFTGVNGLARVNLVRIDAHSGEVITSFNAGFLGGIVKDLEIWSPPGRSPMLVVAGSMGKKLIGLDPTTGRNTRYFDLGISDGIPNARGGVIVFSFAINPAGTLLVATGNFSTVAGQARARLFIADLTGPRATLHPWYYPGFAKPCSSTHPRRIAYLQGVDFSPDGSYFVVAATGQVPLTRADIWPEGTSTYHTVCDAAARFELADMTRPVWINYTGGDSVWSTSVTGAAVYVQGHFRWLDNPNGFASQDGGGAARRLGIGAIHPTTGRALPWAPPKPADIGGTAFLATDEGLWVGSDSQRFNGEPHRGIAFCPL
jgi:hypothetical protein